MGVSAKLSGLMRYMRWLCTEKRTEETKPVSKLLIPIADSPFHQTLPCDFIRDALS